MNKEDILKNLPQGFSEWKPEKYFKDGESIKVFTENSKERRGDDAAYMAKLFEMTTRAGR